MKKLDSSIKNYVHILKPYKYLLYLVIDGIWTVEKLQNTLTFNLRHRN
jgi:hypothetical protein